MVKNIGFIFVISLVLGCTMPKKQGETPSEGESNGTEIENEMADSTQKEDDIDAIAPETADTGNDPAAAPMEQNALIDRMGGKTVLDKVANDFVDLLAADPTINSNAQVSTMMKVNLEQHKAKMAELLCQVAGGPCTYSGRLIKTAHAGMKITGDEWKVMGSLFIKALQQNGVQRPERIEIANLVARYRGNIVDQ